MPETTKILLADFDQPTHCRALLTLLDDYARSPEGGNQPLSPFVLENLPQRLKTYPGAFTILAFAGDTPVGLINAFETLSSFACQPLINLHDVVTAAPFRRAGIATRMLEMVERIARERNCCKITLEVLEGNHAAISAYRKFGFGAYRLDPAYGKAQFWQKKLT